MGPRMAGHRHAAPGIHVLKNRKDWLIVLTRRLHNLEFAFDESQDLYAIFNRMFYDLF